MLMARQPMHKDRAVHLYAVNTPLSFILHLPSQRVRCVSVYCTRLVVHEIEVQMTCQSL